MSAELKAKCEASGVANAHAERVAEAVVNDFLEHCDDCEKDDDCNPPHPDDFDKKNKGKPKKFAGPASGASASDVRDAVKDARAAGFSWLAILQLLLQGIAALLDALKKPVPA